MDENRQNYGETSFDVYYIPKAYGVVMKRPQGPAIVYTWVEKGYRKNQGRTLAEGVRLVCAKPRESIKQSTPSLQRVILMEMQ